MAPEGFFALRPAVLPTIYAYSIPGNHPGYLKIGFTDRDVETRIYEQLHTSGLPHRTELTFSAMRPDGSCFTDHDVHAFLKRRGFQQLNAGEDRNEWFRCSVNDVRAACIAVRDGTANVENRSADFGMRPEQYRAVQDTIRFFKSAKDDDPSGAPKFLWNAKMRFGKTFASYQLAKKMGFKRVLVLTFKPAVESAWREDLVTHVDFEGWQFVSNKDAQNNEVSIDMQFHMADKSRPIVVFGSFQDLLGTNDAGGIKAKNQFIHDINWDLVIFDEYHFGAWRENAKKLFETPDDEQNADFNVEKYEIGKTRALVNSLANYAFLTKDTNDKISDQFTSDYMPQYVAATPGAVESHWIPMDPELWKIENYEKFLEKRRELLAEASNKLLDSLNSGSLVSSAVVATPSPVTPVVDDVDEEILAVEAWLKEWSLKPGTRNHEIVDPDSGEVWLIDLAWPNGIQEGLTPPLALLLNPDGNLQAAVSKAGYQFFVDIDKFKKYVLNLYT